MEKSSERFNKFIQSQNINLEIITFDESTKTSQQAADKLNVDVAQIGKSIVFKTQSNNFVVVITSGVNRVNEKKIEQELNEKLVKTNGEEIKTNDGRNRDKQAYRCCHKRFRNARHHCCRIRLGRG